MSNDSKFNKMRFQRLTTKPTDTQDFAANDDDDVFRDEVDATADDATANLNQLAADPSDIVGLTLEGLRRTYNSCSNCGVCWYEDHVSLDCRECGGYAMHRPCPDCDGRCGNTWRRDVKASHASKRAEWHGACSMSSCQWSSNASTNSAEDTNANFHSNSSYHRHSQSLIEAAHVM